MDLLNVIYAATIVFILFNVYKIPMSNYIFVISHLILIFFLNGVLFSPDYMYDQIRYIRSAAAIRETLDFMHYYRFDRSGVGDLSNASLIFAIFPIPFLNSIYSIAIINFMIYAFLFIFLYIKKILVGNALWFYLFFPSFALYAGVALRDMLILFFMTLSVYLLYKHRLIWSIIVSVPLLFIKFQNFLIFVLAIIVYNTIIKGSFFSIQLIIKLLFSIVLFYVFINFIGVSEIDKIRYSMYLEDGGIREMYIPLHTYLDLLFQGIIGAFYIILKPLPWESSNIMQLFQSFENLFIFYIIYKIIKKQLIIKNDFINFLLVYLFIAMMIYGLIVSNYGAAARYRFTFELIFIIFSMSILYKNKIKSDKPYKNIR